MAVFTSYAQNFEDVILWRALGHIRNGRYIDIGAQSPLIDSVSKGFYDQGWRGIHVEPTARYSAELRQARPDELVIEAAVGAEPGRLAFFEVSGTGLSTARRDIADQHAVSGFNVVERVVPTITLDDVLEAAQGQVIHWLKIDVEGSEHAVLEGWRSAPERPWVVVIESTLPMTQTVSHAEWESLVLAKGYRFVYFDGLNRFYLADGHDELLSAFDSGPNVFDGFVLSGTATSPFCSAINQQIDMLRAQVERASLELSAEREQAARALNAEQEAAARRLDDERQRFAAQLDAAAQQLDSERRNSALQLDALGARLSRYSSRLSESRARFRALNEAHRTQIDRFQAHAQWLENEWALTKARNEESSAAAHSWRIECERLDRELCAVHASTSWRLTAPVRGIKRAISWGCFALPKAGRWLVRSLKAGVRRLLARAMRRMFAHAGLRRFGAGLLRRLPWLERRVRQFATGTGLLTPVQEMNSVDCHSTGPTGMGDGDALSDREAQVLSDLVAGMGGEPR